MFTNTTQDDTIFILRIMYLRSNKRQQFDNLPRDYGGMFDLFAHSVASSLTDLNIMRRCLFKT